MSTVNFTAVVAILTAGAKDGAGLGVGVVGKGIMHSSPASFITLPSWQTQLVWGSSSELISTQEAISMQAYPSQGLRGKIYDDK